MRIGVSPPNGGHGRVLPAIGGTLTARGHAYLLSRDGAETMSLSLPLMLEETFQQQLSSQLSRWSTVTKSAGMTV